MSIRLPIFSSYLSVMARDQERQRQQLEEEREVTVARLQAEKEDASSKLSAEIQQLRADVTAVQRDRDQQLLAAEYDHQRVSTGDHHVRFKGRFCELASGLLL